MNLEVIHQDEHNLELKIEGIPVEMVNAIRRIMITEVPVFAIDEVIILKNDSPLYDEIVSHRLGMIPLKSDLENYNLPRECECEGYGCPQCQVSLTIEVTNTNNSPMVVYSKDLKSNDPEIIPVDPNIPIVKIDKDKSIILEAYAILGKAKDHAKWQAVSNVYYKYFPKVEIDNSKIKDAEMAELVVKMCPKKLFEWDGKKSLSLKEDYWKACDLCKACQENSEGAVNVEWEPETYIFCIESDGVIGFDVLIKKTFEIFLEKIAEFETKLGDINLTE